MERVRGRGSWGRRSGGAAVELATFGGVLVRGYMGYG